MCMMCMVCMCVRVVWKTSFLCMVVKVVSEQQKANRIKLLKELLLHVAVVLFSTTDGDGGGGGGPC